MRRPIVSKSERSGTGVDMANLSKAVCHGESDKCRFGNPPQESNFQRLGISPPNDDSNAWAQRVETFLLSNLDESYIPRFRDGSNIIPLLPAGMSSRDHSNLYRDLQIRIARLNEF